MWANYHLPNHLSNQTLSLKFKLTHTQRHIPLFSISLFSFSSLSTRRGHTHLPHHLSKFPLAPSLVCVFKAQLTGLACLIKNSQIKMAPAAASMWNYSNKTVCVMEASGRLGSALVRRLLHRGYTVHAAVHSRDEVQRYKKQYSSESQKKLRVFHSDPLDYHSILDALRGCSALFYSFELPTDQPTYDEFMGELEVRAAHNVLEACAQTDTIDKVVFTSSATAVVWRNHNNDQDDGGLSSNVDERHWSDVEFCKKFKLWHGLSKTVAEKTAWALAMDRGVNMVTINAGLLLRPDLSIKDPYLLGAAEMFKDGVFVTVDLKFLVEAHICVFEDHSSYGRYLCFNHIISCSNDVVELATTLLPSSSSSSSPHIMDDNAVYEKRISNDKLSKLMVDFDSGYQVE